MRLRNVCDHRSSLCHINGGGIRELWVLLWLFLLLFVQRRFEEGPEAGTDTITRFLFLPLFGLEGG